MSSYWLENSTNFDNLSSLQEDLEADVCIIGAGIFGITTAYYLTKMGFRVIVLEKDSIASKATGHTTAKITSQHGLIYNYLFNSYGEKFARDYLYANEQAIKNIKKIIDEENISCDFSFQNSYVYTTKQNEVSQLKSELDILDKLGYTANFVTATGLPFSINGALQFKNQAQFHPLKYISGLCNVILASGSSIFIDTTAYDVKRENDFYITYTQKYNVKSKYVVLASHYPFINFPGFYFTKMYQSTSYVIAIDTKNTLFHGMYINISSPIYSFRTAKYGKKELLLIGGADHKTGESVDFNSSYAVLENEAKKLYPDCKIVYRWNTRDCITLDKIPYIGLYSHTTPNLYIGTGFNKWGMTSSNVAATIISNSINGNITPYSYVFDSTRIHPIKNRVELKNIIVQSANSLVIDKLKSFEHDFSSIPNDSATIIDVNSEKVGIYKDPSGKLFAVNPTCTHLGCLLSWNSVDKTWDCPCHGSRFDYTGKNIYDPAMKNLNFYDLN